VKETSVPEDRRELGSTYDEMSQFDGSYNYLFEARGDKGCLYVYVDDSSGKVYLRFGRKENRVDANLTIWGYVKQNGIPRNIYFVDP